MIIFLLSNFFFLFLNSRGFSRTLRRSNQILLTLSWIAWAWCAAPGSCLAHGASSNERSARFPLRIKKQALRREKKGMLVTMNM